MNHATSAPRDAHPRGPAPTAPLALLALALLAAIAPAQLAAGPWSPAADPRSDAATQAGPGLHQLLFVMNAQALTADAGALADGTPTVLGELFDTNIARVRPGAEPSAVKWHATPEFCVLVGDPDKDGVFWQTHGGDIDALGVRRGPFAPPVSGTLSLADLVLSTEDAWGFAQPQIVSDNGYALDGSLFRLARDESGLLDVQLFLPEALVLAALGQYGGEPSWDVDIDAFTQDHGGNIYLSFRHDEPVNGTWLADDGVVCLPVERLQFDGDGDVVSLVPDCAAIVLDDARLNQFIQHAELLTPAGSDLTHAGDLQALDLDPDGGRFDPVQPVFGLEQGVPHLLFNGQRLGPTVLTTADGGRIAQLDGQPLGAVPFDGARLGLDGATASDTTDDLNGLVVLPAGPMSPVLDAEHGDVDLGAGEDPAFLLGSFTPSGWAWVMVVGHFPVKGGQIAAPAGPWPGHYPWLAVPEPWVSLAIPVDARGRARLDVPIANPPGAGLWVVVQAVDLASSRLSTPAAVWCPK